MKRGGFTLLEVVLALGVLVLGLSAVLGLLSFGAAMTRNAALRTSSAQVIEAIVADLEETLFPLDAEGEAGEPVPIADRPVPGHDGLSYSARAEPDPAPERRPGRPLEYRVDVEIAWQASGQRRTQEFTTVLAREVPFGARLRRALAGPANPGGAGALPVAPVPKGPPK